MSKTENKVSEQRLIEMITLNFPSKVMRRVETTLTVLNAGGTQVSALTALNLTERHREDLNSDYQRKEKQKQQAKVDLLKSSDPRSHLIELPLVSNDKSRFLNCFQMVSMIVII